MITLVVLLYLILVIGVFFSLLDNIVDIALAPTNREKIRPTIGLLIDIAILFLLL